MENDRSWIRQGDRLSTHFYEGEKFVSRYIEPALDRSGITQTYNHFKREIKTNKGQTETIVHLFHPETGADTEMVFNPDSITVFFRELEYRPVIAEAIYRMDGGLNNLIMEAEATPFETEYKNAFSSDWKENITALRNLLNNEENIGLREYYSESFSEIIESVNSEDPSIELINDLSDKARDQMATTFEDSEYVNFYDDQFVNMVKWFLFDEVKSSRKDIRRYQKNVIHLISEVTKAQLRHFRFIDDIMRPTFSRRLEAESFSANGYAFIEEDIEVSETDGVKKEIIREGEAEYGEKVDIQENVFVVSREGNSINASAETSLGKPYWNLNLPLACDVAQIQKLATDPDADFRKIKDLYPASFLKNK